MLLRVTFRSIEAIISCTLLTDHKSTEQGLTSAHALGRTRRPIRPASLALRTFSNNGTMLDFKLKITVKVKTKLRQKREADKSSMQIFV